VAVAAACVGTAAVALDDRPNQCGRSTATRRASRQEPSPNHTESPRVVINNLLRAGSDLDRRYGM
jgi:hypothetical protein